jgi:hypothetical protein
MTIERLFAAALFLSMATGCAATTNPAENRATWGPLPAPILPGIPTAGASPEHALTPGPAEEGEHHEDHEFHKHHLGLFAGIGFETKDRHKDEEGFALGLEYEYRLDRQWGVGGAFEYLGNETLRNTVAVVPVSYHPAGGPWRLFAGPGIEFTPEHDEWLLRLGAGYSFYFPGGWLLAPEFLVDIIESGERTWLFGLALGRGF